MSSHTKKLPKVGKLFRLYDFDIYDNTPSDISDQISTSSDDSMNQTSSHFTPKDDVKFNIQMFSINETGETCTITVNDYHPFFFIKVGDHWTDQILGGFIREIRKKIGKYYESAILRTELVKYNKLYGFTGGKKNHFVQIVFQNMAAFNKTKSLWYVYENGARNLKKYQYMKESLEIYESNIPPLLRYFHIQNISPSGWVFIKTSRAFIPSVKTTTSKYEYICSRRHVQPLNDKETRVPYKICSFDIEASSSHGDFPIPIKTYKKLATNIVNIFSKQITTISDKKTCQLLLEKIILTAFGYGKFDDVDLVYPKTPIGRGQVKQQISEMSISSIENIHKINSSDKEISKIQTIEKLFDKKMNPEDGENEGGGGEADDDDDETPIYPKKTQLIKKPSGITDEKIQQTIIDILFEFKKNTYTREQLMDYINESLMAFFPKLEGDKVTFIGSTFMNYGDKEPYKNHCIVLGSCDPVENAIIETVDTERDLLIKWKDLIQSENPDIIIGYNIFGFDYEFMFRRSQENHCDREFLKLSRKIDEISAKEEMINHAPTGNLLIENTKIQLATGEYELQFFKMTGRLQIDMYTYFRREFNLSSYKLDDVAGQYIGDSIKRVECTTHPIHGNVTELHSGNLTGLHRGDFIHIEISEFTTDYYKDGAKFQVLDIESRENGETPILIAGHEKLDMTKSVKWGMAKDDVSPQDIFRLANGSSADRAIVAKYCIQDCNLVQHLMNKIDVITGYNEMARICSVPISFLVLRGQGIKLTSYVAKKCREKNTLMPDLKRTMESDGYEGAIVLPPKCNMYMDNPVACVDYASLYPSSMISQNYSHDSKVWTKEYDLEGRLIKTTGECNKRGEFIYDNLAGYTYIDMEYDTYKYLRNSERPAAKAVKTKVGKMMIRWAQLPNNEKSIMPSILEELLSARAKTRKMAKNEADPFMQNILDKRQLGYKVTANSLYGQCGARTSTFYEKDVAASTTATGRMMITYAKRIIEEVYGDYVYDTKCMGPLQCRAEYVYGDTDSVFFTINLENPVTREKIRGKPALEATIEIAQDVANLCTQFLKPPMELTYEKTLMPFILLSKKRYVGMLYENNPNKGKMKYMGLSLKRRDSCDYLKDTYGGILNILMNNGDISLAEQFLKSSIENLINGCVPMDKLKITKALRSFYKNPQTIAHQVLAERIGKRDPGNKPKPGDRMKFVFIEKNPTPKLMGERIETPEYILANHLKLDYTYYITNQLMKPLQQLFGLALVQLWEKANKHRRINEYKRDMTKLEKEFGEDIETFMKKKEKYCSEKIKELIFDEFLNSIHNRKHGIQTINTFFGIQPKTTRK
jgi:DNA polymerase elongation subunit (family B)